MFRDKCMSNLEHRIFSLILLAVKWRIRLHFVLLIIGLSAYGTVYAQQYHLHNMWQPAIQGSLTYKTFEDSKGYLWFLTNEGIARYDGKNTRTFNDKDGYEDVGAYHVVESNSGTLYFVTINFDVYAFSNGAFKKIKMPAHVAWIDKDTSGNVFIIFREALQHLVARINADNSLSYIVSRCVHEKVYMGMHLSNDSFLITTNTGLWVMSNTVASKIVDADTYATFIIARAFRTQKQILLTNKTGIYALTRDMKAKLLYPLQKTEILSICEDPLNKDLWMASTKGLLIFKNGISDSSKPVIISHHTDFLGVMKSKSNSFWISSAHKGIYVTNPQTKHITAAEGLVNDKIFHIGHIGKRVLYFSRDNVYYELEAGSIKTRWLYTTQGSENIPKMMGQVLQINDSVLYTFGTRSHRITPDKIDEEPHPPNIRNHLHTETYGRRAFGRSSDGALTIDDTTNVVISTSRLAQLRLYSNTTKISLREWSPDCIDGDTVYYVTANDTLIKVYWKAEIPVYKQWNIKGKIAHVIHHGNSVYVSTLTHGFYVITGDHIINIRPHDGLLSDFCRKSYLHKGRIWLATNQGISRIDALNPLKITNFTQPDYLIGNEVNDIHFLNDTVYVATSSGVSIFPEDIVYTRNIPKVLIERFQINNRDTIIRDHYELPYTENNFTFHFSSPDYRTPNNNLFRFVIVQHNRTDTTYYTSGIIQLSSLMPGDYTFFISAKNIDGIWSEPVSFSLSILPPAWRTWWFISLVILAIIASSAAVVFFILSRHRQQQAYRIKMAESELKSLRLYMNPHFIFNSLSSLQSFILTYQNKDAEIFIAKFSKLIRSVMSFSQRGEITLEQEIGLLTNYLELEKVRFKDRFDFRVIADEGIDTANTLIPSLLIQPFAENAIKHGFSKLGGRKGVLDITFSMQGEDLYCIITDNGKGRQPGTVAPNHISSGIGFTEERLRLITKDPKQEVVKLIDLESDGKPAGLRVIIYVPILNNVDQ